MHTKARQGGRTQEHRIPLLLGSGTDEYTAYGRVPGNWAYHMRLVRLNGCWVVGELRVFPDSPAFDVERLSQSALHEIAVGTVDGAYHSAKKLAHFVRQRQESDDSPPVPPGGLTARQVRTIPFGPALEALRNLDRLGASVASVHARRVRAESREALVFRKLRTLRNRTHRQLEVATLYVEALRRGSRTPNEDIARQLKIPATQVRDAVHGARTAGFLGETGRQGRAGGELTAKARGWLDSLRDADRILKQEGKVIAVSSCARA